jgi:ADP-ribose pyrophosphatase YjhB (NUDIX family)
MTEPRSPITRYEMPFVRVELATLSLVGGRLCVLLGKRTGEPFKGRWALPGGVLRIDLDVDLQAAAQRVAKERLGTSLPGLNQLCTTGRRYRDERASWAMAVIYRSLLRAESLPLEAGKRLDDLQWMPVDEAREDRRLAFDHADVVARAAEATRLEAEELRLTPSLLPPTFTLGELQDICSVLCGRALDKSSFRRRLAERDLVEPIEGEFKGGRNRPAQVYRWR